MLLKCLPSSLCLLLLATGLLAQSTRVVLVHDNDTHSQVFAFGPMDKLGGLARRATLIRKIRATNDHVLVCNSGDVFVGSAAFNKYFGYPELRIMEGLYDVMGLGNHELDLGPDVLALVLSGSLAQAAPVKLPVLCANIDLHTKPGLDPWISPSIVRTVGPLKVGIFAVITTDPVNYSPDVFQLLGDPLVAAADTAKALRQAGCQVVICLSHGGYLFDRTSLSAVPGIDVILGGHSHDMVPVEQDHGTLIVQAGEAGLHLGELVLDIDPAKTPVVKVVRHVLHDVDGSLRKDVRVRQTLQDLRRGIQEDPRFGEILKRSVGTALAPYPKSWTAGSQHRDTPLGNLVTDSVRAAVESKAMTVDFVLAANGYIGHDLYRGKVTGDDLLRCLPYGYDPASGRGFKIQLVRLYGLQVLGGLEYSVAQVEWTRDLCLEVSGITFSYDSSKLPTQRVDVSSVRVGGNPINPSGLYWVAMNEQLATFLKALGMTPYDQKATGILEYDALYDHVRNLAVLRKPSTGRILDTH